MTFRNTIAAGLIALSALAAAAPASAATAVNVTLSFGLTGTHYVYHDGYGYDWKGGRHDRRGGHEYGTLTPHEVRAVLRDKGYRQIQYLDRRGRIYEVRATNGRGHRVGLVVSARNGAILNVYRL